MKKYEAVLFDMDGTLVPMDQDAFTKGYFKMLAKKLMHHGIAPDALVAAIWDGTGCMVKNDGSKKNEEVFWDRFEKTTGKKREDINPDCLDFYGNEFRASKQFTGENPYAVEAVETARKVADHVVLATNPLFPMVGQVTRMGFVGLKPEDFDLVTSYETDSFCKPNPRYFLSVCERVGVKPENCLLVGNDEYEDMYAGSKAGLNCYLITDTAIPSKEHPWEGMKGSFKDLIEFLKEA